jgi:RecA/RadA recombinase
MSDVVGIPAALAGLRDRWGSSIVRSGTDTPSSRPVATLGSLALAPTQLHETIPATAQPIVRSGFGAIDGLIGGLPSQGTVSLVGDPSSGTTTLALRSMAEAQASGAIGAWLDLPGRFDPLEAAARGVDLRWLVVIRPLVATDGLRIAGSLLGSRSVDLLVLDLPSRLPPAQTGLLRQLAAQGRRVGARVLAIGSEGLAPTLRDALAEASHLRLALAHRDWLRVGREVVGQRVTVTVEKDRGGAPGRAVDIEILYPPDGDRAGAATRLLAEDTGPPGDADTPGILTRIHPPTETDHRPTRYAPPPPSLGPSAAPPGAPRARPVRPRRAGWATVGPGHRP